MLKRHRKINASLKAFRRMTTSKEVTVLGDGAIGVCAALYLQRDGFKVTLIDRDEPARDCSFGNAGLIQCASVVTVATPGIVRQVPRMLLDKSQPLFIQRRYLPSLFSLPTLRPPGALFIWLNPVSVSAVPRSFVSIATRAGKRSRATQGGPHPDDAWWQTWMAEHSKAAKGNACTDL